MNRALFSGVAGMKAHQTRMDVIGNNIANVNTYGYKSQRAVFSDIFYQKLRSATAGTANTGGTNPSTVGYGSTLAAVQSQMTQSSMQSTGYGLDVAITGEGFLQVMDSDGNIFYTKAGMLDYDSNGYLTDINGNFVLGAATGDGNPDSQKIRLTNIPAVSPTQSSTTETLHNVNYTITTENATSTGNIGLSFTSSKTLPVGMDAQATISTTGAVSITLNANKTFTSLNELNDVINAAVKTANGGKVPAYGNIKITADKEVFGTGLTGAEIVGTNVNVKDGVLSGSDWDAFLGDKMTFKGTSDEFTGLNTTVGGTTDLSARKDFPNAGEWTISLTSGTKTYSCVIPDGSESTGLLLKKELTPSGYSSTDYIEVSNPGTGYLATLASGDLSKTGTDVSITAAEPSKELGFSSKNMSLTGGTEGGPVTLDQLTNIAIGADGTITVSHPEKGNVAVGRISLASFANTAGLQAEGSGYYSSTANSGDAILSDPGSNGTGALKSSSLEMSNVDLASEFADMITTQRGYQANARIITVSDTMLEELINLKR
jgi:flagellar hook protein FlgE